MSSELWPSPSGVNLGQPGGQIHEMGKGGLGRCEHAVPFRSQQVVPLLGFASTLEHEFSSSPGRGSTGLSPVLVCWRPRSLDEFVW